MAAPTTTTSGLPLGTRPAGTPVSPALTGTIRIYAVGDSLTVGTPSIYAWRNPVGQMLTAIGVSWQAVGNISLVDGQAWDHYNAVFGRDLQSVVDQIAGNPTLISTADPDIVMMCPFGNNDMGDDTALAAAPAKMTSILESFRGYTNGRGVKPRIVVSYLFGHANDSAKDARHDSFNNTLRDSVWPAQVALGQSITICDPRPFINVPKNNGFRSDYTHPTESGYARLADCYFPGLCNAIGLNAQWGRPS